MTKAVVTFWSNEMVLEVIKRPVPKFAFQNREMIKSKLGALKQRCRGNEATNAEANFTLNKN